MAESSRASRWLATGPLLVAAFTSSVFVSGCTGTVTEPRGGDRGFGTGTCVPGIPETSRIPRLTHEQYDNTIQDLTHLSITPSTSLEPESLGSMTQTAWTAYQTSAATVAAATVADQTAFDRVAPCAAGASPDDCAQTFIASFGRRAFRRALTSEETTRLTTMFAQRGELTEAGSYEDGIQLLMEAMLQAPSFLLRAELRAERSSDVADGSIPLNDFEVASRLSYMLWNSMPDDVLLQAAADGQLRTPEQIRSQAERMLDEPRAREMVAEFHRRYFGIAGSEAAKWTDYDRDPDRYPTFTRAMIPMLAEEAIAFADHVVFTQRGGFDELIMEPTGFVNRDLAPLYGLDPADYGDDLEPVALDPTQRAGAFTRLGFLASHAVYDRTSPILRGAYIQKHVLCTQLGTPPPGAEMTELPDPDPNLVTTRDRTDLQTSATACAGCHHQVINPAGYAFEHYDALGQWRETDNGAPVDSTGTVTLGYERVSFESAVDMSAAIAENPAAQSCYVEQWVAYASARDLTPQDRCVINDLAARLGEEDYSVLDLLIELTQVDSFTHRAPEVTP